jgi:hypothetical protein
MVALFQGYFKARIESTGALVDILAFPLLPMVWIHVVGKLLINWFAIVIVDFI